MGLYPNSDRWGQSEGRSLYWQMVPQIVPSSDPRPWGTTVKNGRFGPGVPVFGDLGDQQAALVGQACFRPGEAKNTYGTGCFMLLNAGTSPIPSKSGLLTTLAYKFGDEPPVYALEGSIAITGALVQWMRDNLGLIHTSSDIAGLARTVEDNGGVYFVPGFSGLSLREQGKSRPHRQRARAAFRQGLLDALDVGAQVAKLLVDALVAALNLADVADLGGAFCRQRRQDER